MGFEDAFGQALRDHLDGVRGYEIIERDDGHIDVSSSTAGYFASYAEWPGLQKEALALVQGRVLDIGCGAGRVSLRLQEEGYEVTGIDISPLAASVCRERGVRDTRQLSITKIGADLGCFDTIVMMGNNFGLFGGYRRAKWLLRRFKALTSPHARIIAETLDPYDTSAAHHLEYHEANRRRGRMGGQVRIRVRYGKLKSPWFDYLFVSRDELVDIVAGTGWRVDRTIDGSGSSYIAVIEKTGG